LTFDVIIKNGRVIDGTGNPWFHSCLCIRDGRVVEMKRGVRGEGEKVLDAAGMIVAPGFIDYHNHSDLTLLVNPRAESYIHQGVTTVCIGNCGQSPAPISDEHREELEEYFAYHAHGVEVPMDWRTYGEYLAKLEKTGVGLNVVPFVGHGTVRIAVMGFSRAKPTAEEMERMKTLVDQSFKDGVFSLSSGLDYAPNIYSDTQEIIELCRVAAKHSGVYTTHTRGSDLKAVKEAIEIGRKAGVPVHILHYQWSLATSIDAFEEARDRGLDVTFDAYPYDGGCGSLDSQLQEFEGGWLFEGGVRMFFERIKKGKVRERLKRGLEIDWNQLYVAVCRSPESKRHEGKSIIEVAKSRAVHPVDAYCDLILENEGVAMQVYRHQLDEGVTKRALSHPAMLVGSDGWALAPHGDLFVGTPHPRCYGTYPRILGRYVREEGALTLQEAVRKMTSFPAQRLGLMDRGLLREGSWADIVVFDPERVGDNATYDRPHRYPRGIEYVLVNGRVVIEKGEHTGAWAGRVLRKRC
jgi:N-acyl-D-amino-acid deacylase